MRSLSEQLIERGTPLVQEQFRHPTVVGIAQGNLDPNLFRSWLEQDYLFLLDYARVFTRLASQAPIGHLGDLVDLAHSTWHEELSLHRALAAEFGADLEGAIKGPPCEAYTAFLLESANDYGRGLAALLPCMWGYSTLGRMLAVDPPSEPRFARWVETYSDPAFAALAARCAEMLDEAHDQGLVGQRTATAVFDEALRHELRFWDITHEPFARATKRQTTGVAEALIHGTSDRWTEIVGHPFVLSAGDGTLSEEAFARWLAEDYAFVVGFRRFLVDLIGLTDDDAARDVLTSALPALDNEIGLFRHEAVARELSLDVEPNLTTLGYIAYLHAALREGYAVALTVLYGAEKAYFDAWAAVRERARASSPYWAFIDNWSSEAFGEWVDAVAGLLEDAAPDGPTEAMRLTFDRVVRFESGFWDAVYEGPR